MAGEFDFIEAIRTRSRLQAGVVCGIGDDAALLQFDSGQQCVVTTDTLVAGVHFPLDATPFDIGYKTAAVNLSDLAAMGAQARFCTLALTMPSMDQSYALAIIDGLMSLLDAHDVALVGGDTTRGPLSLTLTAIGSLPAGSALTRTGAQAGDGVYVSGSLGDAAAGLHYRGAATAGVDGERVLALKRLQQRLSRPSPRLALGVVLRGVASSCIDVSDGLAADLGHICRASGLAALLESATLPISRALQLWVEDPVQQLRLQLSGDDYELCFTVPAAIEHTLAEVVGAAHTAITRIGTMAPGEGVHFLDHEGLLMAAPAAGYEHFQ